jgi:hypothetical protein
VGTARRVVDPVSGFVQFFPLSVFAGYAFRYVNRRAAGEIAAWLGRRP